MKMFNKLTAMILSLFILATTSSLIAGGDVPYPAKELTVTAFADANPGEFGVNVTWLLGDEANSIPTAGFNVTQRVKINGKVEEKIVETVEVNGMKEFKKTYTGFAKGTYVQYLVTSFAWDAKQNQIFGKMAESKWLLLGDGGNNTQDFIKVRVESAPEMKLGEKHTFPIMVETNIKGSDVKIEVKNYNDIEPLNYELDPSNKSITVWSDKEGYKALVIKASITNSAGKVFTAEFIIKTKIGTGSNNDKPFINFVEVPPVVKVIKGKPFTYQFNYKSNVNCAPTFKIVQTSLLDGTFKFDDVRGVLTFTPTEENANSSIEVEVTISCNGIMVSHRVKTTFEQFEDVNIKEMAPVYCTLSDKDNPNSKIEGVAYLFPLNKVANMEKVYKALIENNMANFKGVPAGLDYKLQIVAKEYKMQWNVDASEMAQAESFKVTKDGYKLIMYLTKLAPIIMKNVSGVCLDENDSPIQGATVQFFPYEVYFGGNSKQDFRGATATTNDLGKYEIHLPENGIFIAQASNGKPTHSTKKPQVKFYNNVLTPLEADIIFVDGDITGIDFKFDAAVTTKTNGFAGQVVDSTGAPILATLTAIQVLPGNNSNSKGRVYNSKTDDKGNFTFEGLEYGKYVVLSLPIDDVKKYLPGFLNQGGFVSQKWKEATQIEVNDAMTQVVYVAKHKELPAKQGAGDVSGFVNGKKGIAFKKDNGIEAVETITGAMVYLMNQNGQVVDYSFTEKTGQFAMTQLEDGIYNLVSDAVGFIPSSAQVVINYKTSPSAKSEVTLDMDAVASVEPEVNTSDLVVFPVPANADVTLSFTGLAGKATVNVLSMTGGVVLAQELDVQTGMNISKFDFSNLSAGSYIVTINNNGRTLARTINVIR